MRQHTSNESNHPVNAARKRLPLGVAQHLPKSEAAIEAFHGELKGRVADAAGRGATGSSSPAVSALRALIDADSILRMYVQETLAQVQQLPGAPSSTIETIPELLAALEAITKLAPLYNVDPKKRNAFPMSALFAYMMMTVAGEALFRNRAFNAGIQKILREWCSYLDSADSTRVLNETPEGWLCPAAVEEFQLDEFVTDRVVSANDGNVVSIARGVRREDRFWLKGEPFSLVDMLNRSQYVERFVGGDVFQSFLSGGNYHRWHAPIEGTIRQALVVEGLLFSDAESAGWDPNAVLSEGYYSCVNARGLVFIQSEDPKIGMVCVMPIGITEISSVTITVREGERVKKGQELGYFSYGGSSMCLVFQPGAIREYTVPPPPSKPVTDPSSGPPIQVNSRIAITS